MLTWPPQALTPRHGDRVTKDPARIVALSNQGTCWRTISATDMLYMPPGWWHVSRKDASSPFQASLGLGFALEQTPADDVAELVARELRNVLHGACCEVGLDPERADHSVAAASGDRHVQLSAQNTVALAMARTALAPAGGVMDSVEAALRLRTLHRLAGLVESTRTRNLEPIFPPPRSDSRIDAACRARLTARLLRRGIGGQLVLSVNGASFTPQAPNGPFTEMLRMLETGDAVAVRDLIARAAMMFADFSNSHGHSTPSISSIDGTRIVAARDSFVANSDLALPFAADAPLRSLADFATAGQTLATETMLHVRDARVIFANYGALLADFAPALFRNPPSPDASSAHVRKAIDEWLVRHAACVSVNSGCKLSGEHADTA